MDPNQSQLDKSRTQEDTGRGQEKHQAETMADVESPLSADVVTPETVEQLVSKLDACGLMSADQVHSFIEHSLPPDQKLTHGDQLAQALLEKHKITDYQLDILRQGKGKSLVLGNYVIESQIGAGGMGIVLKARHRRMKRYVAVKVLPPSMTNSVETVARFHREVEAAARLQHANIAAAYDADEADGVHFLVMEFIDGPDLSQYVKEHGPLPLRYALILIIQAARGLLHAHNEGVVHRDIKPGNLLVDQRGMLKILDMGLANVNAESEEPGVDPTELTQSGRVMGTVDYMAPEQAKDAKRADLRADIYSLGCTLHYLTTGQPLSPKGSITEKLLWHQNEAIPALSSVCPTSTPALDVVVAKMLAKNPEDRQQSMAEVMDEVGICLNELSESADKSILAGPLANVSLHDSQFGSTIQSRSSTQWATVPETPPAKSPLKFAAIALVGGIALVIAAAVVVPAIWPDKTSDGITKKNGAAPLPGATDFDAGRPTSTDGGSGKSAGSSDAAIEKLRDQLKWIFDHGGSVSVVTTDGLSRRAIAKSGDLPSSMFDVRSVKLDGTPVGDKELKGLTPLRGLQDLSLINTRITDDGLAVLRGIPSIWSLDLSKTAVTNAGLRHLTPLIDLRDLKLNGTKVTQAGLGSLESLGKLENLYLADTRTTDSVAVELPRIPLLRYVSLRGTDVTADALFALARDLPELEVDWEGPDPERIAARKLIGKGVALSIELAGEPELQEVRKTADMPAGLMRVKMVDFSDNPRIVNSDMNLLSQLGHVENIRLGGTAVTDQGLVALKNLSTLRSVDLGSLQVSADGIAQLKQSLPRCEVLERPTDRWSTTRWVLDNDGILTIVMPDGQEIADIDDIVQVPRGEFDLREIKLPEVAAIGDDDLVRLRGLTQLEVLNLAGTAVTDEGLTHLIGCTRLRDLDLSRTKVTDRGAAALARFRSLRQLMLAGTGITGQGLGQLRQIAPLTHLALADTEIQDADLIYLKGFGSLVWLSLSGTQITDSAIPTLSALKSMRQLLITDTQFTDAGLEELQAALPQCTVTGDPLDSQRLAAGWVLARGGVAVIAVGEEAVEIEKRSQIPRDDCRVISIDLSLLGDRVESDGLKLLVECTELEELNLNETAVDNSGMASLAGLSKLRRLMLAKTRVSDEGLRQLKSLSNLEALDLSNTRTTSAGLLHFAALKNLRHLSLDYCRISNSSLRQLQPHDLLTLTLNYNRSISDQGLSELAEKTNLQCLELAGTSITDAAVDQIVKFADLQRLDLSATGITDAGAAKLSRLAKLQRLRLNGTQVSDSSVRALAQIKTLRFVDLIRTRVSEQAVASLKQNNSSLQVLVSESREQRDGRDPQRRPGQFPRDGGARTPAPRGGRGF